MKRGHAHSVVRLALGAVGAASSACLVTFNDWPLPEKPAGGRGGGVASLGAESGGSVSSRAGVGGGETRPSGSGGSAATGGSLSATGGTPGGGTGGSAGALSPIIKWLSLTGDRAPNANPPNDALGIQGAFYVFGDSCAEIHWDPSMRCAWGWLCDPGANAENWGMSVGFDFRNTGETGSPPNTTLTWNPDSVGAIGVAWIITGTAPGLEVWVLNMEPGWQGQCAAARCYIDGPPDGAASPAPSDVLFFDDMDKDYWGGVGTPYVFDPAATQSLQFKLPAVKANAAPFDFCVDSLGIVLP